MSKRIRRVGQQGFQVEGSEVIHPVIGGAAKAAGLPSNTFWDYEREQAMVPQESEASHGSSQKAARNFLITCVVVAVAVWLLW